MIPDFISILACIGLVNGHSNWLPIVALWAMHIELQVIIGLRLKIIIIEITVKQKTWDFSLNNKLATQSGNNRETTIPIGVQHHCHYDTAQRNCITPGTLTPYPGLFPRPAAHTLALYMESRWRFTWQVDALQRKSGSDFSPFEGSQ